MTGVYISSEIHIPPSSPLFWIFSPQSHNLKTGGAACANFDILDFVCSMENFSALDRSITMSTENYIPLSYAKLPYFFFDSQLLGSI